MKRTLLEVFCGLAALVLMVSFHHQINRLEVRQQDFARLRDQVDQAVATASTQQGNLEQMQSLRNQLLTEMETRLQTLQTQLQTAAQGSTLATSLQEEVERAKRDVATFRTKIATDFEQQKQLVDAYIHEVRAKEEDAALRMSETRSAIATIAGQLCRDPGELTRTMLAPTVQLNGDDTVGSGTLVFSGKNQKSNAIESYVLTSFHVVRNILADTPRAQTEGFEVTVYLPGEKAIVKGKMIASQPKIDAALVKLLTDRQFPNVANVLPSAQAAAIKVWDPVCAVGCPLGNDPVPSHGEVSSLLNELNGANYWMINAPTYFGNSGGGVYRTDTRQLIGVFSKIYTHGKGTPVVVPHMGLCTPIRAVYEWLRDEKLDHLLQSQDVARVDLSGLAAPPK